MGGENELLKKLREREAAKPAPVDTAKGLTVAEQREQAYSADARKARALVKSGPWHSLVQLATEMHPIVMERALKDRLGAAIEEYRAAEREYVREQGLGENRGVGWAGGFNGLSCGLISRLGDEHPEHKRRFAAAWNGLLLSVNEILKVGLQKRSPHQPIELQVDMDAIMTPRTMVGFSGGLQ